MENKIDGTDKKILEIVTNNARIPITILAEQVQSTPAIVRRKIKVLEDKGIILRYRIDVDLNKLGLEFYKAIIYFKYLNKKREKSLLEYIGHHPKSIYYVRSLAPWEIEIEYIVESHNEFTAIITDLRDKFHDIIKNYEFVVITWDAWLPGFYELVKTSDTK